MYSTIVKKFLPLFVSLVSILILTISGVSCGGGGGGDSSRLVWKYSTGSSIYYGSAAIGSDGTIYVGTSWKWHADQQGISDPGAGHKLYAFNPDGTVKWTYNTAGEVRSTPAIGPDGTLYFVVEHDNRSKRSLCAVDSDGDEVWVNQLCSGSVPQIGLSCPAIGADGTVYVAAGVAGQGLFAFDAEGTQTGWSNIGNSMSSPSIGSDGTVYIMSGPTLQALSADLSQLNWQCDLDGDCTATPAIGSSGVLYIGTDNGKLYAIDTAGSYTDHQQRIKWTCDVAAGQIRHLRSSPALGADGTIYVGTKVPDGVQTRLVAVNPLDGTIDWMFEPADRSVDGPGNDFYSSPAVGAGGRIYIGCETNYVYALESDGTLAWKFKTSQDMTWPSPAIDGDGVLYIGNMAGDFYAIQTDSSGLADSPWPKFRKDNANNGRY